MSRRLTFAPLPTVLRQLRADVRTAAAGLGADPKISDQLALVVDELVNNAIEHGAEYRRRGLELALQIDAVGEQLRLEFLDPEMPGNAVAELAQALDASANGMPSLESERGRGLFLMTVYLQQLQAAAAPAGGLSLVGFIARHAS